MPNWIPQENAVSPFSDIPHGQDTTPIPSSTTTLKDGSIDTEGTGYYGYAAFTLFIIACAVASYFFRSW